eukprot:766951-Hanusia_phi.AAC.2
MGRGTGYACEEAVVKADLADRRDDTESVVGQEDVGQSACIAADAGDEVWRRIESGRGGEGGEETEEAKAGSRSEWTNG